MEPSSRWTRGDFDAALEVLRACRPWFAWTATQPDASPAELWARIERGDWMEWFLNRAAVPVPSAARRVLQEGQALRDAFRAYAEAIRSEVPWDTVEAGLAARLDAMRREEDETPLAIPAGLRLSRDYIETFRRFRRARRFGSWDG